MTLTDTLKKLITKRTITGHNAEISSAYDWVEKELAELPLYFKRHEHNGVPSLVITTKKDQKNPKLWLCAHMDVVPGSEHVWTPREENGRLYGRGSWDMKFAIASYMEILKDLGDSLSEYDLGVIIPGDEETGGFNGVKKLLTEDGYRGEAVFLPDGGGTWQFEEAAKGMWAFELVAIGKSVHSSRPWEGDSATKTMSHVLSELYAVAEDFWLDTPEHWHLTCNVGLMSGGRATNQVADEAQVTVDIRSTSEDERKQFEERINSILTKYPTVTRTDKWNESSYGISRDFLLSQSFARIAKEKQAIECGWTKSHGSSDARHFAQFGIPSVLIWPVAGGAHSEEEWIDIADFARFHEVTKEWVKEVASIAPANVAKTTSTAAAVPV